MDKLSLPFHHSCHFHAIITNNEQVAQVKLSNSEIRKYGIIYERGTHKVDNLSIIL